MKKKTLIIALGALLTLAGCGEEGGNNTTSSAPSSDNGTKAVLLPSALQEKFISKTVGRVLNGGSESTLNLTMDLANDHCTRIIDIDGKNTQWNAFVKNNIGGVNALVLDKNNTVAESSFSDESFETVFPNVFASIQDSDVSSLVLANGGELTKTGKLFFNSLNMIISVDSGFNYESSVSFEEGKVVYKVAFDYGANPSAPSIRYFFETIVEDPSSYEAITLAPLEANDKTEGISTFLASLESNNYTYTLKEDDVAKSTYYVVDGGFVEATSEGKKGFVKTSTGYQNVAIDSTGKTTLGEASSDAYGSLLPDFDVAPEIFDKNGDVSVLVGDSTYKNSFAFKDLSLRKYEFFNVSVSENALTLKLEDNLDVVIDNVGTTTLPVDIFDAGVKMNWSSEPEIDGYLKEVLGEDYELPYWEGLEWEVEYGSLNPNVCITAEFDDFDEAVTAMQGYVEVLAQYPQFVKWTEDEWANVVDWSVAGTHGDGTDELYHLNDDFSMEVVADDGAYAFMVGVALYIYPNSWFLGE